jgi:hypothetical protein
MTLARAYAIVFSIGMAAAILSPLHPALRGARHDSFPLSWYPMFSLRRGADEQLTYVVGFDANHTRHIIPSRFYSPGSMNSARKHIDRVAKSATAGPETCKKIATGLADSQSGPWSRITRVKIVRGKFRLRDYFDRRITRPISERTLHACLVDRSEKT